MNDDTPLTDKADDLPVLRLRRPGPLCFELSLPNGLARVMLGRPNTCSRCAHMPCVHVVYVLTHVLGCPLKGPAHERVQELLAKEGLTDAEIAWVLGQGWERMKRTQERQHVRPLKRVRVLTNDDLCPICQDDIYGCKRVHCQACGNAFHSECFMILHENARTAGSALACPMCRTPWHCDTVYCICRKKLGSSYAVCGLCNVRLCLQCFITNSFDCGHYSEWVLQTSYWGTRRRFILSDEDVYDHGHALQFHPSLLFAMPRKRDAKTHTFLFTCICGCQFPLTSIPTTDLCPKCNAPIVPDWLRDASIAGITAREALDFFRGSLKQEPYNFPHPKESVAGFTLVGSTVAGQRLAQPAKPPAPRKPISPQKAPNLDLAIRTSQVSPRHPRRSTKPCVPAHLPPIGAEPGDLKDLRLNGSSI